MLAITDLALTPELVLQILTLSPDEWNAVVEEVPAALDRAMREEIRENTLSLVRRRVPAMIIASLDEEAAVVVAELVRGMMRPNSLYNQARTEELREKARSDVPIQMVTLERNEVIVRAGDIATADHVEALTQIGLIQADWSWWVLVRAALFTLALLAAVGGALQRMRPQTTSSVREFALLTVMVVIWLMAAKFMLVPHDWLPYLYPLAALGMLAAVLLDFRVSLIVTVGFSMVAYYLSRNNLPLLPYLAVGSVLGADIGTSGAADGLSVGGRRRSRQQPDRHRCVSGALRRHGARPAAPVASDCAAQRRAIRQHRHDRLPDPGQRLGITTSLHLTELSRPTHPLLRLLLKASGTYHHTIVVSNMAERRRRHRRRRLFGARRRLLPRHRQDGAPLFLHGKHHGRQLAA